MGRVVVRADPGDSPTGNQLTSVSVQSLRDPGGAPVPPGDSSSTGLSTAPMYFLSVYTAKETLRFYPFYEDELPRLSGYLNRLVGFGASPEEEIVRSLLVSSRVVVGLLVGLL